MFTQKKNATALQKLHSIHVLPNGREFIGKIEIGRGSYQFTFTPNSAASPNGKLVLTGAIKVKAPGGQQRAVENVTATLLATQGSITGPPPMPRQFAESLRPPLPEPSGSLPLTDWTGYQGSVAVMYLKLSPLNGRALGVPADLSYLQINARLYSTSEVERDLHWLYSALTEAMHGERPNEQLAADYIGAINRILKA
ncbi:MAG: hypothetical protein JMDDDDMK_05342 [Acidobacteria bacterium]|nr:hypothetical protein [Acidobacteriota bacterium]